ncbi:3-hydroxyacyl-CoA dehydrogenase NAD-binding domain-containing protein [Saccharopolyspora shandongensis]|uniref:3-hydroxyacyl-CoA dehydrogenase NAD-binding domain-containing protein n=1 Tax=Saccharopolyspora shandongensis TaxID=418495 RepID=UPI0033EB0E35
MAFTVPTDLDARPVAVIGAGTLGRRIAMMFATRGGRVRISDPSPEVSATGDLGLRNIGTKTSAKP